jgi:hypothetical protein
MRALLETLTEKGRPSRPRGGRDNESGLGGERIDGGFLVEAPFDLLEKGSVAMGCLHFSKRGGKGG